MNYNITVLYTYLRKTKNVIYCKSIMQEENYYNDTCMTEINNHYLDSNGDFQFNNDDEDCDPPGSPQPLLSQLLSLKTITMTNTTTPTTANTKTMPE